MRRVVEWAVRSLPFDARGRRAVNEALADWLHEDEQSGSAAMRFARSARSLLAVARVLAGLVAWETVHLPLSWLIGRLSLFALVPAILVGLWPLHWVALVPYVRWPELAACLLPGSLIVCLPLALFYAVVVSPPGRSLPILGLATLAFVMALVLSGWIAPMAGQHWREVIYAQLRSPSSSRTLPPGIAELNLADLTRLAVVRPSDGRASTLLMTKSGLIALCPAFVVLAGALRGSSTPYRRLWLAGVPIAFIVSEAVVRLAFRPRPVPQGLGFWCVAVLSIAISLALNARANRTRAEAT